MSVARTDILSGLTPTLHPKSGHQPSSITVNSFATGIPIKNDDITYSETDQRENKIQLIKQSLKEERLWNQAHLKTSQEGTNFQQ